LLGVADAPKDDGAPGVEPWGEFVGSIFKDLVKSEGFVEDKVILGECLLTAIVESGRFSEGLLAAGDLGSGFVSAVPCLVAVFPDLGDMVPEQSGDSQDPRWSVEVLGLVVDLAEVFTLEMAPFGTKPTKEKLIPADRLLLADEGLKGGGRELVQGKRGVSQPALEAMEKNAHEALASEEGSASSAESCEEFIDPGKPGGFGASEKMGSVLMRILTGGAAMRVRGIVAVDALAGGEQIVEEFHNECFLMVAAADGLAVTDPVNGIKYGGGPGGKGSDMLAEGRGRSSTPNYALDTGGNGSLTNMKLGRIGCQTDNRGWMQGGSRVHFASKLVGVNIQLGD
jgi:hypothetical protein